MSITFDPDGGDLGRATIKPITALELQLLVPHIANILQEISEQNTTHLRYRYAFEIQMREKDGALFVIHSSNYNLPPNVFWYETDGNHLFEIRGASGGVVSSYICYLVTKK